jgi:glycosyltransferase involved in cell wall biosynthesis
MRIKVLHVLGRMNRGGVETWLMHVLRNIDRDTFEFHFAVQTDAPSDYDAEIRSLGGQIHCAGNPRTPLRYAWRLREIVKKNGPFLVIHSHVYFYSGFIMNLAHHLKIPVRIAQSHTARVEQSRRAGRVMYERIMRTWIKRYATHRIGISRQAGQALFGGPFIIGVYGIDFGGFRENGPLADGEALKEQNGIPRARKIVGHVGRFVPEKNHHFIVDMFRELVNRGVDAHLLFVGAGPLLPTIQERIEALGLSDRCTFAGLQSDVVPFLRMMDVTVLPSQWEGLGIVALESQAAGVAVVASTGVPRDVDVIAELVEHIPLENGFECWAGAIRRRLEQPRAKRGDEVTRLEQSQFGVQQGLGSLCRIYTQDPDEWAYSPAGKASLYL